METSLAGKRKKAKTMAPRQSNARRNSSPILTTTDDPSAYLALFGDTNRLNLNQAFFRIKSDAFQTIKRATTLQIKSQRDFNYRVEILE